MSMLIDRDPDDETNPAPSTGLCTRCGENEALPDDEWCGSCVEEIELALAEDDEEDDE